MTESLFGIVHLPTYVIGTIIVILLPGPNSLFVLSTAARHGVRLGYRAACGVFIGDMVLMTLASIGVASLLKANPTVFLILKSRPQSPVLCPPRFDRTVLQLPWSYPGNVTTPPA